MTTQPLRTLARLAQGGRIARSKVLTFTFNGKVYSGYEGDTLASALVANDVLLTSRSFRYHRPRGIFSAGGEECCAVVSVGEGKRIEPNVRATQQLLYDGLVANSQNGWPSLKWDLGVVPGWFSRFLPTGFYYKTFIWPDWKWYEKLVRRMAAVAPAPVGKDSDQYDKTNAYCDLLIIGGGPAGLAAALAVAESGLRIILADDQPEFGGSLLWDQRKVNDKTGVDWAKDVTDELNGLENVTLLPHTTVIAAWDHGYFTAIEHKATGQAGLVAQRLWKIRSQRTILASGAVERPLVFPNNDRPGIMLADSARQYANRYAVKAGREAVIYTNNDGAYQVAFDLHGHGVNVAAIVDVRNEITGELPRRIRELGIAIHQGYEISNTHGYFRVNQVELRPIRNHHDQSSQGLKIECDLLCISGGWNPTLHLLSQAGGKLAYNEQLNCFVPRKDQPTQASHIGATGSANGCLDLATCLQEGHSAGLEVLAQTGIDAPSSRTPPDTAESIQTQRVKPHWQTRPPYKGRQWVDLLHDVTTSSINVAAREGFNSVEHLKRYTTIGMAIDQGKTSNVSALAILGESGKRAINEVGTTTFRPPFTPVSLGALAGREIDTRAWARRLLPLHDWHIKAAGVMEDHSGWQRAAYYPKHEETEAQAIRREVLAARHGVALFDSSSLGKLEARGPDAARFLNRMYINNVETLKTGKVRYGMMLNENGVIIDDGVFARLEDDFFLVSASSAGTAEIAIAFEEWLQTEWPELEVFIHNATTQWTTLTVSGPKSRDVISSLLPEFDLSAESFPHMSVLEGKIDDIPFRLLRVSFTGEMSFEFNVPASYALAAWQALLQAGERFNITPLGMEALDVLRTEKGFLEVGVDTDISTSPLDVGWAVPIAKKAADFIGKRSLSRRHDTQPGRLQLVGLKPRENSQFIPVGSHIISRDELKPEGHVTSSCISPTLGYSITMAMLKSGHTRMGETVIIEVNEQHFEAKVVALGFYDPNGLRINA